LGEEEGREREGERKGSTAEEVRDSGGEE